MRPTPANTHHAWGGKYLVWFGHSERRYFFEALSTHGALTLYSVKCEIAAHELTCQEVIRTSYLGYQKASKVLRSYNSYSHILIPSSSNPHSFHPIYLSETSTLWHFSTQFWHFPTVSSLVVDLFSWMEISTFSYLYFPLLIYFPSSLIVFVGCESFWKVISTLLSSPECWGEVGFWPGNLCLFVVWSSFPVLEVTFKLFSTIPPV